MSSNSLAVFSLAREVIVTNRGTGLLAIFCDLESRWHEEFRAWLAEDMFAARMGIGFRACASYDAVPDTPETSMAGAPPFLTLYECASLADLYGGAYQALRRERGERDAAFHQRMMGMERYTLCAVGSGTGAGEGGLAPFAFVDRFDIRPDEIQDFNLWYEAEYLPWLEKVPGFSSVHRYLAMEGAPRHFILHGFESDDFVQNPLWLAVRREMAWSRCAQTHGAPGLYRRVIEAP